MLLSLLSKEEKMHFLDLLNELISVDGNPTETELSIKNRFGKNAILKGMNLEEGGTTIERNGQIGGHKG